MDEIREEIYVFRFRFSGFSRDNVLRAARTLSDKSVVLNGRTLDYPRNRVFHAEYDEKVDEIQVVLLAIDKEISEIYEQNKQLFASASIFENYMPRLFFTNLALSTKPLESGRKVTLKRVPDLRTALEMISF